MFNYLLSVATVVALAGTVIANIDWEGINTNINKTVENSKLNNQRYLDFMNTAIEQGVHLETIITLHDGTLINIGVLSDLQNIDLSTTTDEQLKDIILSSTEVKSALKDVDVEKLNEFDIQLISVLNEKTPVIEQDLLDSPEKIINLSNNIEKNLEK